uniref:cholesterol 7-desaturase n=1 Tax=Strigamia maritima TaxID=126957 RepID=T1J9H4_STRMM
MQFLLPVMQSKIILHDFGLEAIQWVSNELPTIVALISTVVVLVITYALYNIVFTPINRVKDISEVGFWHLKDEAKIRGRKLKEQVKYSRKLQSVGTVPPVFPNGWYCILESRELLPGDVKTVAYVGETFVVFRSQEGEVYVLDAYCTHLGANLGVGGTLKGSCIECPFHGWVFDGKTGECVAVPYSESNKIPAHSKIRKWDSLEQTGWIMVWYHAEGETPQWYPPNVAEIVNGEWVYKGRTEHIVGCHIQEISENGGDMSHLQQIHSPALMAGVDLKNIRSKFWGFGEHTWNATWKEGEAPTAHLAETTLNHQLKLFSKIPLLTAQVKATQCGPALVYLRMNFSFGTGVFIQTATPVGPLEIRMVHLFFTRRHIPTLYTNLLMLGESVMFERDVMIWNSKKYISNPILVKEDRLLARHRRWFAQFYTENSPRLLGVKETLKW